MGRYVQQTFSGSGTLTWLLRHLHILITFCCLPTSNLQRNFDKGRKDLLIYGLRQTNKQEQFLTFIVWLTVWQNYLRKNVHIREFMFGQSCSMAETAIVKTRQTDWWRHLLAISRNEQGIGLIGGGVPYWRVCGAVHMPFWMQNSTSTRWPGGCVSSFDNRHLCQWHLMCHVNFDI